MDIREGEPDGAGGDMEQGPSSSERFNLEQLIVMGFEAWWANPAQVAAERFDPDIVFLNHCPRHLSALGGKHSGAAVMAESFLRFRSEFILSNPNVTSILTDGLHVAVGWSLMLRHIGTGRSGQVNGMAHITMGPDLRIRRVESFFDTASLAEVGEMLEAFAARIEALDLARRTALSRAAGASGASGAPGFTVRPDGSIAGQTRWIRPG